MVELFYDLVFVFAITQLSHGLLAHLDPMGALQSTLGSLWIVLVSAGLLGVGATTGAALWTARAVLAPVRRLSQAVRSVTQTDELNPIRIYGRDDLGALTQSFNTMLKSLSSRGSSSVSSSPTPATSCAHR